MNGSLNYDTYHYETSQGQVVVLDKNKNKLGTLDETLFTGKLVENVSFKTIKLGGLYRIRNLTGLPSGVPSDKILILSVKAIGEINAPEVINYQLIDQTGSIYNKTIVGSTESAWSSGGTGLQSTVNSIVNDLGNKASLTTTNKTSAVLAINELNTNINSVNTALNNHKADYTTFKNHTHDGRYLRTDTVSVLKSTVDVEGNGGFNYKRTNGTKVNMLKVMPSGSIEIGNNESPLNIHGSNDLLHNGKKIWTEVNDGSGSGLDADKLDGLEASAFARKSTANTFTGVQTFTNGVNLSDTSISWGNGKLTFGSTSAIFSHSGKNLLSIGSNGNHTFPTADLIANYSGGTEAKINFKTSAGDKGVAFLRSTGNTALRLFNYNVGTSGTEVFKIGASSDIVEFNKEIQISGRKLYLQTASPSGVIPEGSIWIY